MKAISWWRLARRAFFLLGFSTWVAAAHAATYYVSPGGSDASPGTLTAPFATLQKAVNLANPGDTIYMRGGTYSISDSGVVITRSGSSGNPINVFSYPGEVPILDGISMTTAHHSGIELSNNASWWHIQGLEIKNAPFMGIYVNGSASNNIIERCVLHHNARIAGSGAGIQVAYGSNNLILNNDSHHNGVLGSTGGDGIGVGSTLTGNIVRGNRVWLNNDDGIDLWAAANVLVENNWSWQNGKKDDLTPSGGNGVGYKVGGGGTGGGHKIRNNLAWRNQHSGFEDNTANLPMDLYNNTGYENGVSNFSFYSAAAFVLKNNLSLPNSLVYITSPAILSNNSWQLNVTVNVADFMSLDFSGAAGSRNADGSLPAINFLKLTAGSDLIDKGVDVGIAYSGSAPDLGADEYGGTLAPPTGVRIISSSP